MVDDYSADAAPLETVRLLADETRWRILLALRQSDHLVSELVAATGLAQNLVSYHLGVLRQAGLVQVHRSDADGRATYYGIDIAPQLRPMAAGATFQALQQGRAGSRWCSPPTRR